MFDPSPKQLDAIANMEAFIGVRSHRTHFETAQDFQDYWDRLDGRCRKERGRRQRQRDQPPSQRRQRRHAAQQRHYADEDTLVAYARRYAERYQPSWAKLHSQLRQKCDDAAVVAAAVARLGDCDRDESVARQLVLRWQDQGRSRLEMRTLLRRRRFAATAIEDALSACSDGAGSVVDGEAMQTRIAAMLRAGKSPREIQARLAAPGADAAVVRAALAAACGENGADDALRRALERLPRGLDERSIIQRMLRRGFDYRRIQSLLADRSADR